jgi:GNAT superfamily N-acetyltransferase
MSVEIFTYAQRPELREHPSFRTLHEVWPEFALHDRVVNVHWDRLYSERGDFQFFLYDAEEDEVLAEGNTIPVRWVAPDPRGVDWVLESGFEEREPTTLSAVQVMIGARHHGRGLSVLMLGRMAQLAREHGLDCLVAPVRPTLKHRYPLTAMERYVTWRREDGELLDPWLRTHARLGAEILAVAPESMRVEATVADWEAWTGLRLPESGDYVVEGALAPVAVDVEADRGVYVEPNVWMRHPL